MIKETRISINERLSAEIEIEGEITLIDISSQERYDIVNINIKDLENIINVYKMMVKHNEK